MEMLNNVKETATEQFGNISQMVQEKIPTIKDSIQEQIPVIKNKFDDTVNLCKTTFIPKEDRVEVYALYTNKEENKGITNPTEEDDDMPFN